MYRSARQLIPLGCNAWLLYQWGQTSRNERTDTGELHGSKITFHTSHLVH